MCDAEICVCSLMPDRCVHLSWKEKKEELWHSFTGNGRNDMLKHSVWQRG